MAILVSALWGRSEKSPMMCSARCLAHGEQLVNVTAGEAPNLPQRRGLSHDRGENEASVFRPRVVGGGSGKPQLSRLSFSLPPSPIQAGANRIIKIISR